MPRRAPTTSGTFTVNADSIFAATEHLDTILAREGYRIEIALRNRASDILQDVLQDAVQVANQSDGFPEPFQKHLLRVARDIPVNTTLNGRAINLILDLDYLGDAKALSRAFHQGARLAEGGRLDGPYEGQALANEDAADRHIFWEALRLGLNRAPNPKGPGTVPIPEGYSWEATMNKYVEIWGNQAPEWLFIQFGQNKWNPVVHQYDILGEFSERFYAEASFYLQDIVAEEVHIANSYQAQGIQVGFTKKGSVRNLATGRFVKKDV